MVERFIFKPRKKFRFLSCDSAFSIRGIDFRFLISMDIAELKLLRFRPFTNFGKRMTEDKHSYLSLSFSVSASKRQKKNKTSMP